MATAKPIRVLLVDDHEMMRDSLRSVLNQYPNLEIGGVVDSFAPGSGAAFSLLPPDNATGNFIRVVQRVPVKIRMTRNPLPGRLVPGLSARVAIAVRAEDAPAVALETQNGGNAIQRSAQ